MPSHISRRLPVAAALAVFALATSVSDVHAVEPSVLANQGGNGVAACATCHGQDGGGTGSFPRLAGLDQAYLEKQLQDFTGDARANPVMAPIAKALSPADRASIAGYYASMKIPAALLKPGQPSTADGSIGARLALEGKWSKEVPACLQCHGRQGEGVGEHFPALAGQSAGYMALQLKAFKDGTRKNDPLELMRHIPDALTDEEAKAVTGWLAGLPAAPAPTRVSAATGATP